MKKLKLCKSFPPNSILCVRIDGRGFSKFTKGLQRPYDERLSKLMVETTKYIVEEHKCLIGFDYDVNTELRSGIKDDIENYKRIAFMPLTTE